MDGRETYFKGGKLVIIKSVLNSLLIYYMILFLMPACVRKRLIAIQNKFLWGGNDENKKCLVLDSRVVTEMSKNLGGLGIGSMLFRNLALIFKWLWRFSNEGDTFWKRITCSVHNLLNFKAHSKMFKTCKWGIWGQFNIIQSQWSNVTSLVEERIVFKLGNGETIRFWEDTWVGNAPLRISFPRLFSMSIQQTSTVKEIGYWRGEVWIWQLCWRRKLFQWEECQHLELRQIISTSTPIQTNRDETVWKWSSNGIY